MIDTCTAAVARVDIKGFVYCEAHGRQRGGYMACRPLLEGELARLGRGEAIAYRVR